MQTKGVDIIINNPKRPYPEWIKNHQVFRESSKIDKVFPKIGLPNFKEPTVIMNTSEALAEASNLGRKLSSEMTAAKKILFTKLESALKSTEKNRNEVCCKIQSTISLLDTVIYSIGLNDYIKNEDGKVVLRIRSDIFNGDKNPIFKSGESLLRVVGKIWAELDSIGVNLLKIDQYDAFKSFSRVNLPNKKYMVCFSSYDDDGLWDIATISMRGIVSCQAWTAPQSRGLIGSLSSRFVGVIYVESDKDNVPGFGGKMLNRSMVRFTINKQTKKPALWIDTMYPNYQKDTMETFKKVLREKSGLDVFYTNDGGSSNYYIPYEPSSKLLKQGESSYMDNTITISEHKSSIKVIPANITSITLDFKKNVSADLDNMIKAKRELYLAEEKRIAEQKIIYDTAKKTYEEEMMNISLLESEGGIAIDHKPFDMVEPKMDEQLKAFGGGGVMNLLNHIDKKHGKGIAGTVFSKLFLDSIPMPENIEFLSKEEYHRKYLMSFLKNSKTIKEEAHKKFLQGSWMKSFPKSGEKFFEMIYGQMKSYFIASCKDMIRKLN